jgi:hypothetical protein
MRTIVTIITALLALALPATSSASDAILSGYGGPGNAEQALLGGQLLTPPAGGTGSGAAGASPTESLRATGTTSPSTPSTPAKRHHGARSSGKSTTKRTSSLSTTSAGSARTAAPKAMVYPTREGGTGGLPLSDADLLLVLLALVGLVLGGFGLRRLATGMGDPAPPQASPR